VGQAVDASPRGSASSLSGSGAVAADTAATLICTESGFGSRPARLGRIDAREQVPGGLFGVRDGSLAELGGEGGQHLWRAGRQSGCCVLGELVEQAGGRRLADVVAAEQDDDDDLLVALGAEAGGDVLDGAGERGPWCCR
jgi:hypothetical protein